MALTDIIKIRDIFRYARPYSAINRLIDGTPNHFYYTNYKGSTLVLLEKGINQIHAVKIGDAKRIPAIVIRSSPHKIGSETTPWQDVFDTDNGHIRYYGDNKKPGIDPALAPGNKILLEAFSIYNDPEKRKYSSPLIFYKAVKINNKAKGYLEFNGFGIINGVELVSQYDRKLDRTFSNYAFNFHVFSMSFENEIFDWRWINDRRNRELKIEETMRYAPSSWRDWIKNGNKVLERNRRRVSKLLTKNKNEQIPKAGSREERVLLSIYKYYHTKKARFEGLASAVTAKIIGDQITHYKEGWITPASSDGGADFYGRAEIGVGFGKAKLIVLGQAKCESVTSPTGGNHIARTVARLRRGWIGVYVTTSFFSESVQREIIEDEYPILLINGLKLAQTVNQILYDNGHSDLIKYLDELDAKYEKLVQVRRPDELLFE